MDKETSVESFLIVNVKKWIIDYDTKTIEIEVDGYKISEDESIKLDVVIANTIQYSNIETRNFTGKYCPFQTKNGLLDSLSQEAHFYIKFESKIIYHFISCHYDSNSLVGIDIIYSQYKRSREK